MKPYHAPLAIYVVWHPRYNEKKEVTGTGKELAEFLFSIFNRDITNAVSRGLGIPVFFRYQPPENNKYPLPVPVSDAERSIVILLIDNKFALNWREYVEQIVTDREDAGTGFLHRIIPVALDENVYKISPKIKKANFINLFGQPLERQKDELKTKVTHELCRLLYNEPRISEAANSREDKPITLFLSYARLDGEPITQKIKAYVDREISLNTFMDKRDIPPGREFDEVLESSIVKATLLIILTDAYSSREWCRWEVLKAKRHDRPVVVVNVLAHQEVRSFPYLGNTPVVRYEELRKVEEVLKKIFSEDQWKEWEKAEEERTEALLKKILHVVLFEILRYEYSKRLLSSQLEQYAGDQPIRKILASPPELLTLVGKAFEKDIKDRRVIYPDPPLTNEERDLLGELEGYYFFTPTTLAAYRGDAGNKNEP